MAWTCRRCKFVSEIAGSICPRCGADRWRPVRLVGYVLGGFLIGIGFFALPAVWLNAWVYFFSSPAPKGDHSMTIFEGEIVLVSMLSLLTGFALIEKRSIGIGFAVFVLWLGGTIMLKMEGLIR